MLFAPKTSFEYVSAARHLFRCCRNWQPWLEWPGRIALAALASSLFVVDQRQFGVVYQFGQIQRVINEPGLYGKIPLIQTVAYIDKRLLTLDSQDLHPVRPGMVRRTRRT